MKIVSVIGVCVNYSRGKVSFQLNVMFNTHSVHGLLLGKIVLMWCFYFFVRLCISLLDIQRMSSYECEHSLLEADF